MIRIRTWKIPSRDRYGENFVNVGMRVIDIQIGPKAKYLGQGRFHQFKGPRINVRWRRS